MVVPYPRGPGSAAKTNGPTRPPENCSTWKHTHAQMCCSGAPSQPQPLCRSISFSMPTGKMTHQSLGRLGMELEGYGMAWET